MKDLGVDLDGVLGDLAGSLIKIARQKYDINIAHEDITCYQLEACTGLTREQIDEIYESTPIFQDMEPIPNAREVIGRLKSRGWQIHIITDRFRGNDGQTTAQRWLEKNGFIWDRLSLVRAQDKSEFAKMHHISFFIEDNYDTVKDLALVCTKVILFDKSYNQGPEITNVVRVTNWQQIDSEIPEA
jgi:uncharacterized HAD superfamily protein